MKEYWEFPITTEFKIQVVDEAIKLIESKEESFMCLALKESLYNLLTKERIYPNGIELNSLLQTHFSELLEFTNRKNWDARSPINKDTGWDNVLVDGRTIYLLEIDHSIEPFSNKYFTNAVKTVPDFYNIKRLVLIRLKEIYEKRAKIEKLMIG